MHEKVKPGNKLIVFVTESHYFLFFFNKNCEADFWVMRDMKSPYKAMLIHLSWSSTSVQLLPVTTSFCQSITLKSC